MPTTPSQSSAALPPKRLPPSPEALLLALATGLAKAEAPEAMLELVAAHLRENLRADRATICLIDQSDPEMVELVALPGSSSSIAAGTKLPIASTIVGTVIRSGEPQLFVLDEREESDAQSLKKQGVVAAFVAPLRSGETTYGTFNIGFLQKPEPSDSLELLVLLAELLGSQLGRVDAQAELQRETEARRMDAIRIERLHDMESHLFQASNLNEILAILSSQVSDVAAISGLGYSKVGSSRTPATEDLPFDPNLTMELSVFVEDEMVGSLWVRSSQPTGFSEVDQATLVSVASFVSRALQRIKDRDELLFIANHDHLTGLVRRHLFDEAFELALRNAKEAVHSTSGSADENHEVAALCFIDLDHFKLMNDMAGHVAGDGLLRDIAARIQRTVGSNDVPSRLGADFTVLLSNRTPERHYQLCQSIVRAVADIPFISNERVVEMTASVGLAFFDHRASSVTEVLASAEAACQEAKRLGGDQVALESTDDVDQAARRTAASWIKRLQQTIENDDFVLHAQPIHPLQPGSFRAAEVLVRIQNEDGSLVPPDRFIPIAEQYGLICQLDAWVARNALDAMRRAIEEPSLSPSHSPSSGEGGHLPGTGPADLTPELIFINLSINSISAASFFERLKEVVLNSGVPTDRIVFEITETGSMHNFETTLSFVNKMREIGPRFAMDDFGVGLSSLGYLRQLDVDFLKIDGSLIHDVGRDPIKTTMVGAIKSMADALNIRTIAEHVADDRELTALRNLGIDGVQGYFVGHPAAIERALRIAPADRNYGMAQSGIDQQARDIATRS